MKFSKPALTTILSLALLSVPAVAASQQDPAKPTQAPFPTDANAPQGGALMGVYDDERAADAVPLDKPHRTTEQVGTWIEEHATTAMNIDAVQWDNHIKNITPDFDPYGLQEYQNYLNTSGILNVLKTNQMRLSAIMDGSVTLLSQGAIGGTYHWLYQMPLMLTYYDEDTKTLKNGKVQSQNQRVMVRAQIGRVVKGADDNNIVIERWSVTPIR